MEATTGCVDSGAGWDESDGLEMKLPTSTRRESHLLFIFETAQMVSSFANGTSAKLLKAC